jgi:hypothetical protein
MALDMFAAESSNLDASIDLYCPCHRDTMPRKGIVSTKECFQQFEDEEAEREKRLQANRGCP